MVCFNTRTPIIPDLRAMETTNNKNHMTQTMNYSWNLHGFMKDKLRNVLLSNTDYVVKNHLRESLTIDTDHYLKLKKLEQQCGLSLLALTHFVWHKVLHIYSNSNQTVVANFDVNEQSSQTGESLSRVVVNHRGHHEIEESCLEAIGNIEKQNNSEYSEQMGQGEHLNSVITFSLYELLKEDAPFPLVVNIKEEIDSGMTWSVLFDGDLIKDELVQCMLGLVGVLIESIASNPKKQVTDLIFLTEEQKCQMDLWNNTDGEFPSSKRFEHLFEEAVARTPDKVAIVYDETTLTYQTLNERSNLFANSLLSSQKGVEHGEIIALFLDTSELLAITVMGIWKSGAAFVPIDPSFPDQRIQFVIEDTKAKRIVANSHYAEKLKKYITAENQLEIVEIESLINQMDKDQTISQCNPALDLTSDQPAYMTYTSGTTGVPKGVLKIHKSAVNSITDLTERYGIGTNGDESIVLFSPYVFEPFVRQLLMALINGHRLVMINEEEKHDPYKFPRFINKHGITYLHGTASVLQQYDLSDCPTLLRLVLVGEELTPTRYKQLRKIFKGQIIGEYSFTESAFVTSIKVYDPEGKRTDKSIGKCLRNVKWYVLNDYLKELPVGTIGELYIGGEGISKGYWNRPELTEARFLTNPLQTESEARNGVNGRIYQTGDLARRLPNGEVEYLGRNDFQLKLNGIRIEPGEIETVVGQFPGVKQCIVQARESKKTSDSEGAKFLVGYYVAEYDGITENDLITYLRNQLPRYMIPARMIQIERFPVTINGKIDLNALQSIDAPKTDRTKVFARNEFEEKLSNIWSHLLGLPVAEIGITDDFFRLGGDSIACIQFIAHVRRKLNIELTIEEVFEYQTLEKISDYLSQKQHSECSPSLSEESKKMTDMSLILPKRGLNTVYLANGLQQGFMYQYLKRGEGGEDAAYVMQSVFQYSENISPEIFKSAWEHLQKKYSALRLRFLWEDEPLQMIVSDQSLYWEVVDLTEITDSSLQDIEIAALQQRDKQERYCLETDNLFRIYLIKQKEDLFSFLFSCHHIILDGWSLPIIFDDFHRTYETLILGERVEDNLSDTYEKAQSYLQAHRHDHVDYWTKQIDDICERGDYNGLIRNESRYKVVLSNYDNIQNQKSKTITFGDVSSSKIKALCANHNITLHSVLQFIWHRVLRCIGNGRQTVVGTVVAGRNLPIVDIEQSVGLLINTLPLVVDHQKLGNKSVLASIKSIQAKVFAMNTRSNVELGQLQKGEMKHQLFDTLFVLENHPDLESKGKEGLCFRAKYELEKLDYPLAVIACESEQQGISFTLCYASELFNDSTICMLLDIVDIFYKQVADDVLKSVSSLDPLSSNQLRQLNQWNETNKELSSRVTLHQRFEEVVANSSDRIALVYEDTQLTYQQLNEQSNQLAHYLRSLMDIQPDTLIVLMLDKSEKMMVSIFGVWKSGAAYVPVDPTYPKDRINYILDDTQATVIITNQCHSSKVFELQREGLQVLSIEQLPLAELSRTNPNPISTCTDLAYVIYTSGTTGNPKGVMVEHEGVVNLQASLADIFSLNGKQDEAFLSFSNYVFDHFVEQMTDALLNGQKLVVLNDEMRSDKLRLYQYISDNQVTYLSGTPSVLSIYEFDTLKSLTRIDAVGEDFGEPLFNKIRSTFDGQIINGYGPTEVSITTHKRPYSCGEKRINKSIGNLVANITCYVLDDDMKRLPVGAIGELYLGGVGVARGYLNRKELSEERFVANPFQSESEKINGKNARIYKTGDVVRWLENGEVEYLGRTDSQVKIRGLRIELTEIEAVISSYPGVSQAVVVSRDHETSSDKNTVQKYLVGFYVSTNTVSPEDISGYLHAKLPVHLVPNQIISIEYIPVSVSGKLNTKALPKTSFSDCRINYIAPSNGIQIKLCNIWSQLLGIAPERIGVNDNFFTLGGDSILATRLAYMITDVLGRNIGVAGIFNANTIALQSKWLIEHEEELETLGGELPNDSAIVSLAQERMLFIDEFERGTNAYNIVIDMALSNDVDSDILKQSLQAIVARHSILRTLISDEGEGVRLQKVVEESEALEMFCIRDESVHNRTELDALLIEESKYVFSFDKELPIKVCFVRCQEDCYLSIVVHHISFDGWSWNIFQRDLKAFYEHFSDASSPLSLPSLTTQYTTFSQWQRGYLTGQRLENLTDFWTKRLNGFESLNLFPDFPRPAQFDYSGAEVNFSLDDETTGKLRALARDAKVSFYSLLTSAYCLMLGQYSNQQDIVIGMPVTNRNSTALQNLIGFFANMLVLRVNIEPGNTLLDYVQSVSREVINAQIHQEMPFEKLVKLLGVDNDSSRHPIFQAIFAFDLLETKSNSNEPLSALEMKRYIPNNDGRTAAKYDLSGWVYETDSGLQGNFTYATTLFGEKSAARFLESFIFILKQFSDTASLQSTKISDIHCVDRESYGGLIDLKGQSQKKFDDAGKSLNQVFEDEVARKADQIALVYNAVKLTYRELNERANQLAHYIRDQLDIRPDDIIAILLDKSEDLLISILAVWKAGAAYVPIDPSAPRDRIDFILNDTKAKMLITHQQYVSKFKGVHSIVLDNLALREKLSTQVTQNYVSESGENSLAYVIYTSGTTGQPKGVLVEHKTVVNLRNDLKVRYFGENNAQHNAVLLLANYVFDFSVEQIIVSVLSGNKMVVYCNDHSSDEFYRYANDNELTYMSGTPTHIQQFDLSKLKHLNTLVVAGEAFKKSHYQKIRSEFDGTLINAYGVTESTVYNTIKIFKKGEEFQDSLGIPLSNIKTFVLNEHLQLLPKGAVGELYLGGDCISRGYLNRASLSAELFIPNPFQTEEEKCQDKYATLYKTGDIVRYLPCGELNYLGRNDLQVKIRGLRVELGEIESVLATFPGVKQCIVVAHDDESSVGDKKIVGYFVAEALTITESLLIEFLKQKLPNYMVPSRLVPLDDHVPITINGKVDIKALPAVSFAVEKTTYTAPRNGLETALCRIWSKLLKADNIGIDDDFFRCGGDSILAMTLVSQIQCELRQRVRVKDLFEFTTIRAICDKVLNNVRFFEDIKTEQGILTGSVPMLPIQEWFFAKPLRLRSHWNQSFGIKTPVLDKEKLQLAIDKLTKHHDAFRLRFDRTENGYEQYYDSSDLDATVTILDVSGLKSDQVDLTLTQWQSNFNIEKGQAFCIGYLHGFSDGSAVVWFAMHHLIVDTVSWRILIQDLHRLYSGGDLGRKGSSYRQWAETLQNDSPSSEEEAYWLSAVNAVSSNNERMYLTTGDQCKERFVLSDQQTKLLLTDCHLAYNTRINDLLLTALGMALKDITGDSDHYVTLEGHGREDIQANINITNTVGWFTSMYPFLIETGGNLESSIARVKDAGKKIPRHGLGYGALCGYVDKPMPKVSFNYLGQFNENSLSGKYWSLADEFCDNSRSQYEEQVNDNAIDVTAFSNNNKIYFDIHTRLGRGKTEQFKAAFSIALEQIIDHTVNVVQSRPLVQNLASQAITKEHFDPYVEFNESLTDRPILFVLPPGEGGAESYFNNIAKQLTEFRLVIFNNYYLHHNLPDMSFEELANYYLKFVREIQPSGPYHFLGWSFGGVMSFEMSRQLVEAGQKIAYLQFIDAYFNVRKASCDIQLPDEKEIIDKINYRYSPNQESVKRLVHATDNIALFKAIKMNDTYTTQNQERLYRYYQQSSFNNLDTLISPEDIVLVNMVEDTHVSWVDNKKLLASMTFFISSKILKLESVRDVAQDREVAKFLGSCGLEADLIREGSCDDR